MPTESPEGIRLKPRSAESQEHFEEKIKEAFLMAGDREPIGEVLSYLASVAFEGGLGRDQAARQIIASDAFKRNGLAEEPLRKCIRHEISAAYEGRKGRKRFPRDQRSVANQELEAFLEHMDPRQSVTGFFRDFAHGRTKAGPVLSDSVAATVSQGSFLKWATHRKTIDAIKRRFKAMVQPVVSAKYREYIKNKPEEYIANFLNDVFIFRMIDDPPRPNVEFKIGNLRELFLDIADAVDFQTFWNIFSAHAEASLREVNEINCGEIYLTDFFNVSIWQSSIEAIWRQVRAESVQQNHRPEAVERTRAAVRQEVGAVNKIFFVIVPPGNNGFAASKMTVEIQNRAGRRIGRTLVKPAIQDTPPDEIRKFARNLLTGSESSLAKSLRAQNVFLEKNGPEVKALAGQLSSYRPPLQFGNGKRRSKR